LLQRYNVSVFCAAATELRQLVAIDTEHHYLSALKLTVSAGESVNPEIVRSWKQQTGSLLLDGYGQTETLMTILNYPTMKVKPGSMGKPLPGTDAAILDSDGQCAKAGTTGQLAIRSPNPQIMIGYWNDQERTDQCFIEADGKRWFITGDTANMDEIILKQGYSADSAMTDALQEHTKALTAPYKYPRKIEFVTELPKTVTGKIQRRILKQRELRTKDSQQ